MALIFPAKRLKQTTLWWRGRAAPAKMGPSEKELR